MTAATRERLARALRPYPFELLAVGMALAAFAFLKACGLRYGWNTVEYTFPPLVKALPRLFVIGVALRALHALVTGRGRGLRDYLRAILRWEWLARWLRGWVAIMLFIYTYSWLKISIPLVREALYDPQLWRLDRFLHFGFSPSVFAVEATAGTWIAGALDRWYTLWLTSLSIVMAFFFAVDRERHLRNFVFAVVALWTVGAWIYWLVPALGPCYASPDVFEPIRAQIPDADGAQRGLWAQYLQMVKGRTGLVRTFHPEFGVAAMPSLHVGAHALFFFWTRRHERWLMVPSAVATALTFLGSIVTGWHYAVDGYVGLLLAWFAVWLADRVDPVPADPAEVQPAPAAAPAP